MSDGQHLLFIALTQGFITGLSLILPIGAQNAFVLKIGLLRQHIFAVALLCALADALLIALGTAFVGVTISRYAGMLLAVKLFGCGFLLYYGARAFINALRHAQSTPDSTPLTQRVSLHSALTTILGFTFLNPHVYLDTFLLLGSIGNQYRPHQYGFAFGAASASLMWFFSLGYGARLLTPLFAKRETWILLEILIGTIMWVIAYKIWVFPLK